jgi:parvulin-like peptidyl-prolyl isomerase
MTLSRFVLIFAVLLFGDVLSVSHTLLADPVVVPAEKRPTSPPPTFKSFEELPEAVASIDGVPISRSELWARAQEAKAELAMRGMNVETLDREFLRSVLNDLIGNRLLYADLKERGLLPPKEEVDRRYQEVLSSLGTPEERRKLLADRAMDEAALRREVEEAFSIRRWVEQSLFPSISVAEEELKQAYAEQQQVWRVPESVQVVQFYLPVAEGAAEPEVKKVEAEIAEYRKRLIQGEPFDKVARDASGGGWDRASNSATIARGQLPREIEASLFGLEKGGISVPIRSRLGFHLFRVEERQPARTLTFEEVAEPLQQHLREMKLTQRLREIVEGLARKRKVEIRI